MKYIEEQLIKEKFDLEDMLAKVRKRSVNPPEGRIYIKKKETGIEYYYNNKEINKKNGKYIKKKDIDIAKRIAQRDYDLSLLKNLEERIRSIDMFIKKYQKTNISKIYEKTNTYRRELLEDVILSDEEYIKRWEAVEYEGKSFSDDAIEIYTDRGERVRSKSEKIIADRLNVLGIPYRYEYPLQLRDNTTVYPDFTLLDVDTKKEVYLEHCGLMDEQDYVNTLIYKLKSYERNGIYLGVNLFITYETSRYPFNGKALDELIKFRFSCTKESSLVK